MSVGFVSTKTVCTGASLRDCRSFLGFKGSDAPYSYCSQECRNCGHIDKSNRDGEKFICVECGYHEHADIGAAKTIRDRALEVVRADCAEPSARHSDAQKISPRSKSKRGEFGNPSNRDIKAARS